MFMSRFVCGLIFGLALVILAGRGSSALAQKEEDKEVKEAQKDILKLAKDIEAAKKVDTAAIRKKYEELEPIMHAFKPFAKGGIGFDQKKGPEDGIEVKIQNLAKDSISAGTLRRDKANLIKIAQVNIAIGRIAQHYAPEKPKPGGKGPKDWKKYNDDMIKAAQDFIKAAKAEDPAKLKAAATEINSACNKCHSDFRDI